MQRKCYVLGEGGFRNVFPNLYVLLISPPGVGKSAAISITRNILIEAKEINIAPAIVSKERFVNLWTKQYRFFMLKDGTGIEHSSFNVLSGELVTFLRPGDKEFIDFLTLAYDMADPSLIRETHRHETEEIKFPFLNLIGGITPKSLSDGFGDMLGRGFFSRIFLVYSEDKQRRDFFERPPILDTGELVTDLKTIREMHGEFTFDPAAKELLRHLFTENIPPKPSDPRFEEYNSRREIHLVKLAFIRSAARSNEGIVSVADLTAAHADMVEMERDMALAIELIGKNPYAEVVRAAARWLSVQCLLRKRPVSEGELRSHLHRDIPMQYIAGEIDQMIMSGKVEVVDGTKVPSRLFMPGKAI